MMSTVNYELENFKPSGPPARPASSSAPAPSVNKPTDHNPSTRLTYSATREVGSEDGKGEGGEQANSQTEGGETEQRDSDAVVVRKKLNNSRRRKSRRRRKTSRRKSSSISSRGGKRSRRRRKSAPTGAATEVESEQMDEIWRALFASDDLHGGERGEVSEVGDVSDEMIRDDIGGVIGVGDVNGEVNGGVDGVGGVPVAGGEGMEREREFSAEQLGAISLELLNVNGEMNQMDDGMNEIDREMNEEMNPNGMNAV